MRLLSFAEYAKHRGVSRAAVTYAVQQGRISVVLDPATGQRRIDPEVADQEWGTNTNGDMRRNGLDARGRQPEPVVAPSEPPQAAPREPSVGASSSQNVPSLTESRSIKEAFLARLAKIEYEERSGKLIPVDKVKVEAFKLARTVRDAILNIPDRISNELASYANEPAKIHERLTQELIAALEELVNAGKNAP